MDTPPVGQVETRKESDMPRVPSGLVGGDGTGLACDNLKEELEI